jgi:GR25 family glycosyltransferase involved in LPS biosynthesis
MLLRDFDKMYCINLASRKDRKKRCEEIFCKFNLNVTFIDAIDGKLIKDTHGLKPGAAGCCMSQKKVYEHILSDNKIKTALIMEDDVEFDKDLGKRFYDYYKMVPNDWMMIYFGGSHRHKPIRMINRHVHRLKKTYTTHCYAIKREAIEKIMERFNDENIFSMPADMHLAILQKILPCYGFMPHIAWQRADFSDIENEHKDYKHIR